MKLTVGVVSYIEALDPTVAYLRVIHLQDTNNDELVLRAHGGGHRGRDND